MADNPLNAVNRGVYISDNLPFLKSLNDGCIDLVCIDPPFAKNGTFGRKNSKAPDPLKPPLTEAERETELALLRRWGIRNEQQANEAGIDWPETRYKDIWSWEQDVHETWLNEIDTDYPAVASLIEATRMIHGEGTAAYLCYMAVRLFEIRRVLKDTGSLYLHCDHTAGAYLRQLLDAVFEKENFRNEIVWCYTGPGSPGMKQFNRKHDTVFWYTKGKQWSFNKGDVRVPYRDPKQKPRKRFDTGDSFTDEAIARMRKEGKVLEDWWADIAVAVRSPTERTGYPTQKPVALAERIIKASCPEGGAVLDCFAGCAYVAVAAERLNREWLACDINPRAWTVFKRQFSKPKLATLTCAEPTHNVQPAMLGNIVTVHGPDELPVRTSPPNETQVPTLRVPERKFKVPASDIPERDMLVMLLELSEWKAWCCGFANRMPDGDIIKKTWNFHLDHLNTKSREGTSNRITNRAPMCPRHNIMKGNQRLHLAEYRQRIADAGEMMVESVDDLINLDKAVYKVQELYFAWRVENNPQIPFGLDD